MAGIAKQIIGSFENIGKDIAHEVAQVPKDIGGKALESLGTSSQKSQKPAGQSPLGGAPKPEQKSVPPREWLAELAGKNKKQQEPTVQERLEREEQEKKEAAKKQQAFQMAPLPAGSSKAKRGNLYGIKQKSSSEMSKNVRQD